jgi:hypothetical protein
VIIFPILEVKQLSVSIMKITGPRNAKQYLSYILAATTTGEGTEVPLISTALLKVTDSLNIILCIAELATCVISHCKKRCDLK